jgi:hypothetical protein
LPLVTEALKHKTNEEKLREAQKKNRRGERNLEKETTFIVGDRHFL